MKGNFNMLPTWQCKDGRVLLLRDMETQHIERTMSMLRRKGFISEREAEPEPDFPPSFGGEMAQLAAEQEFSAAWDRYLVQRGRVHPALDHFEAELNQRPKAS
jgi:hypothetical protein